MKQINYSTAAAWVTQIPTAYMNYAPMRCRNRVMNIKNFNDGPQ